MKAKSNKLWGRISQTVYNFKGKSKNLWNQSKDRVRQTALSFKEIRKRNKTDIILTIGLISVTCMWFGISTECYSWFYAYNQQELWVTKLCILMDKNILLNVPICIILLSGFCFWWNKILKDKDFRLFRFPIIICSILILFDSTDYVYYTDIWYGFDYGLYIKLLLGTTLVVMSIKGIGYLFKKIKNKPTTKTNSNYVSRGFTNDDTDKTDIPENPKIYVSTIVEKLMETQIDNHSFAIGITGEWGSGKTTILEAIEKEIKDKTDIVKFNPWMCRTPEQVTQDFFASLRRQLSTKHSTLSKSILKYAKYINGATIQPHSAFGFQINSLRDTKSLFETKKELSERLKKLSRPIVVFIDDLDRLERDEVFEVLRLIRNTGDLSKVIFIASFDKEYVTSILRGKSINNPTSYLEKIFQVEIPLPQVEDYSIWDSFINGIKKQDFTSKGKVWNWIERTFKNTDQRLIIKVLGTYRLANRFARIFMLNLNYGYNNAKLKQELNWKDLFWLVLLQIYDKNTYKILWNEPYCLLYTNKNEYILKKGILPSENSYPSNRESFTGEPFWKQETPNILVHLFRDKTSPLYIKHPNRSICYLENYDNYFSLCVSPFKLSFTEMNKVFTLDTNIKDVVNEWIKSKSPSSMIFQFNQININEFNNNNNILAKFLETILFFGMKTDKTSLIKDSLQEDHFQGQRTKDFAKQFIIGWLNKEIKETSNLKLSSKLLNTLYQTKTYDCEEMNEGFQPLIISNENIEKLLLKGMKLYLKNHPEVNAIDVMKEKGEFPEIFTNCCVNDIYYTQCGDPEDRSFKQIAFDLVIQLFEIKESKPSITEYESAYKELFAIKDVEDEEDNYAVEEQEYKMKIRFGNSYKNDLNKFKQRCFSTDQKVQESAN